MKKILAYLVTYFSMCLALFVYTLNVSAQTTRSAKDSKGEAAYTFTGPYSYKNLGVYLIHGADRMDTSNVLTLEEAIKQEKIKVHETGSVNKLSVENLSKDKIIFLQAGDIVKGGKQDRVLGTDLIIEAGSGRVPIESFCVEQGRWRKRGNESTQVFTSSKNRLSSKSLKLAAQAEKEQGRVWQEVTKAQQALSAKLGKSVNAPQSGSSLQLSLEDKDVQQSADAYYKSLHGVIDQHADVIGYVFAINGKLNSADVYPSHELFKRLWSRLLKATAVEALAEEQEGEVYSYPTAEEAGEFVDKAEKGKQKELRKNKDTLLETRETDDTFFFDSRLEKKNGSWLHRNYIMK